LFYHRLAAQRGISVKQLLAETNSLELSELQAFDRLEPIDSTRRIELALAIVASVIANTHRSKETDPFTAKDFMRDWGKFYFINDAAAIEERERDVEEKRRNIAAKFAALDNMLDTSGG
jgi:uncharacterized protein YmfQ (DUF2313 family)